jgi:hypothetical protein
VLGQKEEGLESDKGSKRFKLFECSKMAAEATIRKALKVLRQEKLVFQPY